MSQHFLLGDEAVAMGAVHAGLTAAYGYPGTPSTEIMEALIQQSTRMASQLGYKASWSVNEKTALEQALGVSMVGRRSLVTMKHVGLNVAADPFMNGALVSIHGGLVIAVADDPGMHSSQNEQDTRYFADFAHTLCMEPADQQQAYEMTREAFDLSERFKVPVILRLVTRLAHSRAPVTPSAERKQNALAKGADLSHEWNLLPSNARNQWHSLLQRHAEIQNYTQTSKWSPLTEGSADWGVITTGVGYHYYMENAKDLAETPWHLHIGAYPIPAEKIRMLCSKVKRVLVIEEGYPYVERMMQGVFGAPIRLDGKLNGVINREGELTPEIVRTALGLKLHENFERHHAKQFAPGSFHVPGRPPQLCQGCPHVDTYKALREALSEYDYEHRVVASDIGCYTLGALPPYSTTETCVCMGASIGMAKGASDAGFHPNVAVIGDSTFLHSGIAPLVDAVAANPHMTLIIMDNEAVAMTGGQQTLLPSSKLQEVVRGTGVNPEHFHVIEAHRKNHQQMVDLFKREIAYEGLSVIITVRECIETAKRKKTV